MRLRLQKLDDDQSGRRGKYRFCIQNTSRGEWICRTIRQWRLADYLMKSGVNDPRDVYHMEQQARAAIREWGARGGYAEFDAVQGVRRLKGRLADD